jgi:HEAT repeat protein
MNDENLPGAGEEQGGEQPQVPEAPPAAGDFGGDDFVDSGEKKVGRGNKGMLIVFLVLLAGGAVTGVLYYLDHSDQQKWQTKLEDAAKLPDGEFEAALREIMEATERNDILEQVAFELGEAKDTQAIPLLIKAVSKGDEVGEAAAMALAKIGGPEAKKGVDAIYEQMLKTEELRKAKHAWALCTLGDDRGFAPLLEAVSKRVVSVKSIPEYDPDLIARVGTTSKLIELADAEDPMLRMYSAMELGFRTDKDPVPALLKLVKDKNDDVARAAAISLGRTADERAGAALLEKIKTNPDMLDSILSAVTQSVGSPGLESIYNSTKDAHIKYKIVAKLKKLRDPRSADLLLRITDEKFPGSDDKAKLEADEIRNHSLWTLEELGDGRIADKMFQKTLWERISEDVIKDPTVRYRQEDMARKIANGVATWFGTVKPEGASEYLMKIYEANEPYSNTPECAQRVKVDIGPLMDAMGRTGDQRFCKIIEPFLDKDEGFYSQAASMALGRLKCKGVVDDFLEKMVMTKEEREEEKFSTLIESRDWQMEGRLQERRNSIIASRYLGDPKVAETLMEILLDPVDDPELRQESADSLAYVADEEAMNLILEKIQDEELDSVARENLIKGLWHNPSKAATDAMITLLEGEGNDQFVKAAALVMGEAGLPEYEERLNKLLDHDDERRRRAGALAVMLGGNLKRIDRVLEILNGQEARLVIREWYETHPIFLTKDMFDSRRVFKRLAVAKALSDATMGSTEEILWPWKHLMQRLKSGWDTSPGGLTSLEVRRMLAETVRTDDKYRELSAHVLGGLGERGYLLALQSETGPQSMVARETLRSLNIKSQ